MFSRKKIPPPDRTDLKNWVADERAKKLEPAISANLKLMVAGQNGNYQDITNLVDDLEQDYYLRNIIRETIVLAQKAMDDENPENKQAALQIQCGTSRIKNSHASLLASQLEFYVIAKNAEEKSQLALSLAYQIISMAAQDGQHLAPHFVDRFEAEQLARMNAPTERL